MMIGKRISDRYKILEMIGGGGMANVYLAHDMILDRDVAVKVLRLDFANSEEFIRRFHREAQSATSLAHPNIVSIYDVGEEDSIYYIVMEHVKGQTLKQYIQLHSPVPIENALSIMRQITSAISHAHQNHIIHRDIKPQNILLDEKNNVKITDFGIAMALSATSITQTNSVLGSVHYLSPEQARGGVANHKSDIYSLGIVMFELLTGRLPFSGESAVSIALMHLQTETPSLRRWNPNIPQSVENIVLRATAKDPFHRYESVEEMEEDIRTALDPIRADEPKFMIPVDEDATKAIPIITDDTSFSNLDETIVHANETTKKNEQPVQPVQKNKSKKKSKKLPIILISIFSALVLLMIAIFLFLPALLSPKDIEVPDVAGLSIDQAVLKLVTAGFIIGETKEISDEEIKDGDVIRTDPKAGRMAKEGTEIIIYKSTGKAKFKLLDYKGRNFNDVVASLNDKEFKDIKKIEIHDDSVPGTILGQNYPQGNEVVPEETILEFEVSKGPEKIKVKDLSGYTAAGVQAYADDAGLIADVSQEEYHESISKGNVISQDPKPGTMVEKDSKITVIISKGAKELPPKSERVEVLIPYNAELAGAPQIVHIFVEDMDHDMDEPYDTFAITQNETRTIDLMIAPDTVASYRIMVGDQEIASDSVSYPKDE
ncbi:Stk1 family PASTA domain-containing Ser/Thr kinase [Niallia sp. Krafla_26]|uniref:Stk1 family PASTA domain-containing Ser/Thr kinase n=1 Tax=Niallia sp. Krafla_26 TaxID=3064703 RepID=UPI003D1722B8